MYKIAQKSLENIIVFVFVEHPSDSTFLSQFSISLCSTILINRNIVQKFQACLEAFQINKMMNDDHNE